MLKYLNILGPKIGKMRGPAKVTKQYEAIGGKSPL